MNGQLSLDQTDPVGGSRGVMMKLYMVSLGGCDSFQLENKKCNKWSLGDMMVLFFVCFVFSWHVCACVSIKHAGIEI